VIQRDYGIVFEKVFTPGVHFLKVNESCISIFDEKFRSQFKDNKHLEYIGYQDIHPLYLDTASLIMI